jgi:sarcosine oxidase subunit gamma
MADRRRSPLQGLLPWAAASGAVSLAEPALLAQIGLRLKPPSDTVAGIRLPLAANRVAAAGAVRSLWLGPDEWLLTAPGEAATGLAAAVSRALAGRHAAVTDLSAARAVVEVAGPRARPLIAAGCSLDLHPRAFAPDRCAQSLLAGLPIILDQLDAAPRYRIFVRASSAGWLIEWLIDAAQQL